MSIQKYITTNYDIILRGNSVDIDHLENVEEFVLVDDHQCLATKEIHAQFLNEFFDKTAAIRIEAQSLDQTVKPTDSLQACWINENHDLKGWDIGSIEKMVRENIKGTQLDSLKETELNELLHPIFESEKLGLKYQQGFKSLLDSEGNIEDVVLVLKAIEKNNPLLMRVANIIDYFIDKTFLARQKSFIQALNGEGKKALLVGQIHLYKSYYQRDVSKDGDQGRALVQKFLSTRNVVVLKAKPDAIQEHLAKIQPIEDELLKLAREAIE